MKAYIISLFLAFSITAVSCQLLRCPRPEVQRNFTVSEFLGKWYIVQETKGIVTRVCPSLVIKEGSGGTFSILLKEKNLIWKKESYTKVSAELNTRLEAADITVWYEGPGKLLRIKQHYSILDTDYKTYAVVWGCNKILGIPHETVFILGRQDSLSDKIIHHALDLLDDLGLKRIGLDTTFQDGCFDM